MSIQLLNTDNSSPKSSRRLMMVGVCFLILISTVLGGVFVFARSYHGKVLPGLHIGAIGIGGMTQEQLQSFLEQMNDRLGIEGITMMVRNDAGEKTIMLYPVFLGSADPAVLIDLDTEKETDRLLAYGRGHGALRDSIMALYAYARKPELRLENIMVDKPRLAAEIQSKLGAEGREPQNANVNISSIDPLEYTITPSKPGIVFQYDQTIEEMVSQWSRLQFPRVQVIERLTPPEIVEKDVESVIGRLPAVLSAGELSLTHTNPHTKQASTWTLSLTKLQTWLAVERTSEHGLGFGLDPVAVQSYLTHVVEPTVNVKAQDAKFRADETGKVVEFLGSRPGMKLDIEKTYRAIDDAMLERSRHDEGTTKIVSLVVNQVEPHITTGEVNNLGISEVLGVGVSSFAGSPKNRTLNIKNAVEKLNGILVKPGDTFSTLQYTRPFTEEGGYLPELVIKGDAITPEVGGGLCQIGTTLFRMAMNSGMLITSRRNHSLVISYYNDPSNGQPGTDATVYDPAPDFKFKNDTGQYILIQTEMNQKIGQLVFTLWGTSDGRKGYYSAPLVDKWYPYAETRTILTTKLKPGEKQCQHAYKGADASFTYTRELSDGKKEDTVFTSHYRPLPEICLVGVAPEDCEPSIDGSTLCVPISASSTPIVME